MKITPKNITGNTVEERIYKAFISHDLDSLSDSDKNVFKRISKVDALISQRKPVKKSVRGKELSYSVPYSYKELVEWLVEHFKISHRQAYIDIDMAKRFFLSLETREDKEFGRGQQIAIGYELMFEAQAVGDYKSAAAFYKEINEIKGLKKTDPEQINPEDLIPTDLVLIDDPSELGFPKIDNVDQLANELLKTLKGGVIKKMTTSAEDVDYE